MRSGNLERRPRFVSNNVRTSTAFMRTDLFLTRFTWAESLDYPSAHFYRHAYYPVSMHVKTLLLRRFGNATAHVSGLIF